MKLDRARQQVIAYAKQLNSSGLSAGKSGNVSVRTTDGFLITPTGVEYSALQPSHIAHLSLAGQGLLPEQLAPSSEWHFHSGIYRQFAGTAAIVHAHPPYCTALACTGRRIPAFHYMVAVAGGTEIPIAAYQLFGTEELSQEITSALNGVKACLIENHGMVATGKTLEDAYNLAIEVETLAHQYVTALQIGEVKLLSPQQMRAVIMKFKTYGQGSAR